jgi:shikimate kinase
MDIANRQVVLIGMMGSGKTTCGRLLAERLGWGFWDCDEALMESTGSTAAEVQRSRGQAVLHAIEHRLLRNALQTHTDTVFAAAGSAVLRPAVLARTLTVWLRASPIQEERNIATSGQQHRPLLHRGLRSARSDQRDAGHCPGLADRGRHLRGV